MLMRLVRWLWRLILKLFGRSPRPRPAPPAEIGGQEPHGHGSGEPTGEESSGGPQEAPVSDLPRDGSGVEVVVNPAPVQAVEGGGESPDTPVSDGTQSGGEIMGPDKTIPVSINLPNFGGGQPGRPERDRPAYEPPENPLVHREAVRMMLLLHYHLQGASGPFRITDSVRSELSRLIPSLDESDINRLSAPAPVNSIELFKRLIDAGYLALEPAASSSQ